MDSQTPKPHVAVFSTLFLQYSQTFVYDQLRNHQRYLPEVFCQQRINQDRFPFEPVHSPGDKNRFSEIEKIFYRWTTLSLSHAKKINDPKIRVLHAHFGPGAVYALPYRIAFKKPLIVTLHGYDVPLLMNRSRYKPANWRYWVASKWMLKHVDRFLAASEELASMIIQLGAPKERVRVERMGIALPKDQIPKDSNQILMVGRFVEKKGFEYGIRAFSKVSKEYPKIILAIAGGGQRRDLYEKIVKNAGIQNRVKFLGILSHEEIFEAIDRSAVLIAPSVVAKNGDRESGLVVVKEAAARCVPTIGTWHGGIPEIIDDQKSGYLVPEKDENAIAERLHAMLSDNERRMAMGKAARRKMEIEYDIRKRVASLESHYDDVIAIRS